MTLFLILCAACAVVTAAVAKARGCDPLVWFFIGFLCCVVTLIAVLVVRNQGGGRVK